MSQCQQSEIITPDLHDSFCIGNWKRAEIKITHTHTHAERDRDRERRNKNEKLYDQSQP